MSEFREKRYNFRKTVLIWLLISAFFVPVTAYADVDNPFLSDQAPLLASYANKNGGGLSSVDYEEVTIELIFAHNVADVALRENNASAISVRTEDGENISAEIGFSDAFADRCSIYVTMRNLYPSMTYYIYIAPNLTAYNGTIAGIEQSMSFHTKEEVINDGSDQGYDQGETDPGNDTGGEKQGEETADGKTGEDAPDLGDEINEEDMVIITDNGSETTDPEEEEPEEEEEEEPEPEEEEEPEPEEEEEPDKPDMDSAVAAGTETETGENLGPEAGEGVFDYPGEENATSGQEEAPDASRQAAQEQPESEIQEEAPQPEEEAEPEPEPEQLPEEEEQPQPETDKEEEGQQIVQDSRKPERAVAGILALALLTAAVSDRIRKRRVTEG